MNASSNNPGGRRKMMRYFVIVCFLIVLIGGTSIFFLLRPPRGPKLLNQPTKAREVRPFSTKPDPRFAPLPLEKEKHGK